MVNKVRVNIAGAQYAFATTDSEKYITSLAEKLDRDILHTFIERIEVSKKVLPEGRKVASHKSSCYSQNIRIFYRFVGELHNLPEKALDIAENY